MSDDIVKKLLPTLTSIDNSINEDLDGVLVSEDVDQLKGMLDNAHSHKLLAVVAAAAHQRARQSLHNRALSLSKSLSLVSAGSVGNEGGILALHGDVVLSDKPQRIINISLTANVTNKDEHGSQDKTASSTSNKISLFNTTPWYHRYSN
jgi:hypothetical protein